MYTVVVGNIHIGYTHWGPFKSEAEAEAYVEERGYGSASAVVTRIYQPIKD